MNQSLGFVLQRESTETWRPGTAAEAPEPRSAPGDRRATNEPLETSSSCAAHSRGQNRAVLRIAASFVPGLL